MAIRREVILLVALLTALVVGYWQTIVAFHERWASSVLGYSHGYPVLLIMIYVLYERSGHLMALPRRRMPLLLPALFILSIAWLMAGLVQVQIVQQLLLPAIVLLWLGAMFGVRVLLALLTPFLLIYLAVPVWDVLVLPLRVVTVAVVQEWLKLGEYPAYIDGFYISVPMGKFVVAGGCSGLNYFLTSMTLAVVYSVLYLKSWQRRLVFGATCLFLSLLVNWIRVFVLVLIGYYTDMQSEIIGDHEMLGWLLFALVLVPIFWLGGKLEQPATGDAETAVMNTSPAFSLSLWFAVLATVFACSGPLLGWSLTRQASHNPAVLDVDAAQGWQQISEADVDWWPEFSGFDRRDAWQIRRGAAPIVLKVMYYDRQAQGKELVYDGNRITAEARQKSASQRALKLASLPGVREEIVVTGGSARLVWWYYWVAGRPHISDTEAKISQLSGMFRGRFGAALVSFEVVCRRGEDSCAARRQELESVVSEMTSRWLAP